MSRRFPKKRLVAIGDLSSRSLGLSRRRGEELALIHAWSRAAGPALAPKTVALGVRRGVLEIGLREDDASWRRTFLDVLPRLAASVAAMHPELGIERVQLVSSDGESIGPAAQFHDALQNREPHVPPRNRPRREARDDRPPDKPLDDARLEKLMRVYLERCSETEGSSGG